MSVEKTLMSGACKPRRLDFIKYANDKSYTSNKNSVLEDCFNRALVREYSVIALNFSA